MLTPPAGYAAGGERAWVFPIRSDVAVRALRARAADGRLLDSEPLGLAPPQLGCGDGELLGFLLTGDEPPPPLTGPEAIVSPPGGPPLRVADADAELCVALGPAPADRTCRLPSPWLVDSVLAFSPDGPAIGGAVDPAIVTVEARATDGSRWRVATDPGAAYSGRYAGLVRFFSLASPAGKTIESFALLDAAGRRIDEQPLSFDIKPIGRPRVLLRGHAAGGRFDLAQASFAFSNSARPLRCLAVVRHGKTPRDPFGCIAGVRRGQRLDTRSLTGEVRCDLRGAFLVGGASRRAASVRARLADGSTSAGRVFDSALGRAFLVLPPAARGLRRVEVLDRAGHVLRSYTARVPPARRQCGYAFSVQRAGARGARAVRPAVPAGVGQPYAALRSNRLTGLQWQRR
jgi:hypothetical protein